MENKGIVSDLEDEFNFQKLVKAVICFFIVFVFIPTTSFAQNKKPKYKPKETENYFGIQFKPVIPFGFVGDQPVTLNSEQFESTVSPAFGYYYGGLVRIGLTKLLALETGINYVKRSYNVAYQVPDSNLRAQTSVGFVSFEIPLDFLVYIKLGKQFYMNTSVGFSGNFNPSNIRSLINPEGQHLFIFEGRRVNLFDFNVDANVGFEYRTEESGTLYLGVSARIPFSDKLQIATEYRYDTQKVVAWDRVRGSIFGIDIKYFFPLNKKHSASPFMKGPIEQ